MKPINLTAQQVYSLRQENQPVVSLKRTARMGALGIGDHLWVREPIYERRGLVAYESDHSYAEPQVGWRISNVERMTASKMPQLFCRMELKVAALTKTTVAFEVLRRA
ncbi:MAG: hypothetical protein OXQ29_15860 [Rhodospirillaceae bacterium]|nr:hypothetical protein [Rhodospirillaceae bacterium]